MILVKADYISKPAVNISYGIMKSYLIHIKRKWVFKFYRKPFAKINKGVAYKNFTQNINI